MNEQSKLTDAQWRIEYGNDTGPNDEGFWEWWTVTNGVKSFKCGTREDAEFLCAALAAQPVAKVGYPMSPIRIKPGNWCAPGDRQQQRWMLTFDDASKILRATYTDETEARDGFARAEALGWNCYLWKLDERQTAQPVAPAEQVGEIVTFGGMKEVSWRNGKLPAIGTKLYAAPPAAREGWQWVPPAFRVERPDDERMEFYIGDVLVGEANHDDDGWSGMDRMQLLAKAVYAAMLLAAPPEQP